MYFKYLKYKTKYLKLQRGGAASIIKQQKYEGKLAISDLIDKCLNYIIEELTHVFKNTKNDMLSLQYNDFKKIQDYISESNYIKETYKDDIAENINIKIKNKLDYFKIYFKINKDESNIINVMFSEYNKIYVKDADRSKPHGSEHYDKKIILVKLFTDIIKYVCIGHILYAIDELFRYNKMSGDFKKIYNKIIEKKFRDKQEMLKTPEMQIIYNDNAIYLDETLEELKTELINHKDKSNLESREILMEKEKNLTDMLSKLGKKLKERAPKASAAIYDADDADKAVPVIGKAYGASAVVYDADG